MRYALRDRAQQGGAWSALLERELAAIPRDREALIWAIGCAWAVNVERFMCKARPISMAVLLGAGLYVGTHHLLIHLTWFGLPRDAHHLPDQSRRDLLKLNICVGLLILLAITSPGEMRRRLIAAAMFPFMAASVLAIATSGLAIIGPLATDQAIGMVACGMLIGAVLALLLTLPFVLMYRGRAVPIAALALLPAIAQSASQSNHFSHDGNVALAAHMAAFACAFALLAHLTKVCRRWLGRVPGEET
jgi:hypothetical protein